MPKRTIYLSNPATIKASNGSIEIKTKNELKTRVPLEDIWVLIIESHEVVITAKALSEICEAGIGTILCGSNHMPNGLMLPLGAHSRHASIVEDQLLISKPLKKQLWQAVVQQKIRNQATVLSLHHSEKAKDLFTLSKEVLSDDSSGREAVAASIYFREIAPEGGRRNSDITPLLDYGYAILRAGIARCAVAGGWLVSRGIHHSNNLNAFNLVDDLIEPYRPIVDLIVLEKIKDQALTTETKRILASIFSYCFLIEGEKYTVQSSIEETIHSFKRAILENDSSLLKLPQIIPLSTWSEEE